MSKQFRGLFPTDPPPPPPSNHSSLNNLHGGKSFGVITSVIDPIYKNKFEIVFDVNPNDCVVLSTLINKMSSNSITYSVNIIDDGSITPLDTIIKYLGKPMTVHINYLGKGGGLYRQDMNDIVFRQTLVNFQFTTLLNLIDINYNMSDIQYLEVGYSFEKMEYTNYQGKKNVRLNKVSNILEDKDFSKTIDGKYFKF